MLNDKYSKNIESILNSLGCDANYLELNQDKLFICIPESSLEVIHKNVYQRPAYCTLSTKLAWEEMFKSAMLENIFLKIISSYRSVDYQAKLISNKLAKGLLLVDILKVNAAPGFSEHHTGRALDLTTSEESDVLTENFEKTQAFAWLNANAEKFGFKLSYPKNNDKGFIYEPWHWCFHGT
jgi:D-alanyl-D-alanine carboxypeptidase